MLAKILVENDIEFGARLVEKLESHRFPLTAAFWLYLDDIDEWRLFIVSPLVSERGPRLAHTQVTQSLYDLAYDAKKPMHAPMERIFLVSPNDSRYKQVKAVYGEKPILSPVGNLVSGDIYVYRMS